jgi:hypothetical protein
MTETMQRRLESDGGAKRQLNAALDRVVASYNWTCNIQIIRTVRKDRLLPLWHVQKIFDPWVSTTTIQDVLKKYGYH